MTHTPATMDEHCADAGSDPREDCDVEACPVTGLHCSAMSLPLAPGGELRLAAALSAWLQGHLRSADRLRSRFEFSIFRPPIA